MYRLRGVANDSEPSFLFANQKNGTFSEEGLFAGVALNAAGTEQASMGVAVGDYNRDGSFDLFVTNFSQDANVLYENDGSAFFTDQFNSPQGAALSLNLIDWLLLDEALLAMRSRGLSGAPIDDDLSDGTKTFVKYGNIVGLPLAFVAFGLVRWRRREARRSKVKL